MSKEVVDSDIIVKTIRKAVSSIPGIRSIPEKDYVDIYLEALEEISSGLEMRQDELAS